MGKANNAGSDTKRNIVSSVFDPAFSRFVGLSQKLQARVKVIIWFHTCFQCPVMLFIFQGADKKEAFLRSLSQSQLKNLTADKHGRQDNEISSNSIQMDLEKQLDSWRGNASWADQPPVVKVINRLHLPVLFSASERILLYDRDNLILAGEYSKRVALQSQS